MKIGISRGKRNALVIAILIFSLWWYLQSWVAYRHVAPSFKFTREQVALLGSDPAAQTEPDLIHAAWYRGTCDTTSYVAFRHYPVLLVSLLALALLAIIPDSESNNGRRRE